MVVARAEHERGEHVHVVGFQRTSAGQTDLDRAAGRIVGSVQAGGQRRRIVGDDKIAGVEVLDEVGARLVRDAAGFVDDEQPCG